MLSNLPLDQTAGTLFVLAAATLLIGGIGVLNMMLDVTAGVRRDTELTVEVVDCHGSPGCRDATARHVRGGQRHGRSRG